LYRHTGVMKTIVQPYKQALQIFIKNNCCTQQIASVLIKSAVNVKFRFAV